MADAVASQTLFDGLQRAVMKFTNISDGTGESKVTKVNPSDLNANNVGQACTRVTITKIHVATHGMEVLMYWDASTDVLITVIPQNSIYSMDLTGFGGFWNNAGAGITGSIQFSTSDASAGDTYTVTLEMIKTYG
jgi:hypothetical protein